MSNHQTRLVALFKSASARAATLDAMVARAADWDRGPAAQNLDPDAHGWRYQDCSTPPCARCPHPVPVDPTGESAGGLDRAARYQGELSALLIRLEGDLRRFVTLGGTLLPEQPRRALTLKERHAAGADVAAEGWCRSCWRNDQTCNPIELRPGKGTTPPQPYYRGYCRWCGRFRAPKPLGFGQDPPLSILRMHHEGRRISEADVAQALRVTKRKG